MVKNRLSLIQDMLDSARIVLNYVSEKDLNEFLDDLILQDAVCRRLAIIGEAAYELYTKIDRGITTEFPNVPWKQLGDFRHFLVHHYNDVNMDRVWNTIVNDVPSLVKKLEAILLKSKS